MQSSSIYHNITATWVCCIFLGREGSLSKKPNLIIYPLFWYFEIWEDQLAHGLRRPCECSHAPVTVFKSHNRVKTFLKFLRKPCYLKNKIFLKHHSLNYHQLWVKNSRLSRIWQFLLSIFRVRRKSLTYGMKKKLSNYWKGEDISFQTVYKWTQLSQIIWFWSLVLIEWQIQ